MSYGTNILCIYTNKLSEMVSNSMINKKKLVIFGSGTLAEVATYYFEKDTEYELIGYVEDDDFESTKDKLLDRPIFSFSNAVKKFSVSDVDFFVSIGYRKTNTIRQSRYEQVKSAGYSCASYVSPKAVNYSSKIGDNCFILENNVLQPFTIIGNNVIMWSGNHLGHHSILDDNVFVTSHVVISGKCKIGRNSFLGVNSCLHDGVVVGQKSVIGAGSIVSKSCKDRSVFLAESTASRVIERDLI